MSETFDPALVSWRWHGDPDGPLGLALALHYGDRAPIFPSTALGGVRRKYLLRDLDVIVKAETCALRLVRRRTETSSFQSWDEARIWADPRLDPIRDQYVPIVAGASAPTRAPQPGGRTAEIVVGWVAQQWQEGRVGCNETAYGYLRDAAEEVGLVLFDVSPNQIIKRTDGTHAWLDYGLWEFSPA